MDDLLREGFFTLAKAKCEKSNAAGIFQITPTRACATKRIRSTFDAVGLNRCIITLFVSIFCDAVHGYKSEHLVNLKASQRSEVAGVSRTGSAKDFIRELSAKYHCDIGIDHEDLKSDDKNEGEIKLSNSLSQCKDSFSAVVNKIEDIVQIIYKLNCLQQKKETIKRDQQAANIDRF